MSSPDSYVDVRNLIRRTDQRFPRYRQWFREAAEQHGLSFMLLAAPAYQESHWRDIKRMLPLLSDPKYYRTLKYGYARGHDPVRYVQRIREYHHVLANESADEPVRAIPHRAALGDP